MVEGGVCLAVMDLALTDGGVLRTGLLTDAVVRAAILADLALAGALGEDMDIDVSPTGFEPADRLLAAIVADPTRPLGWWLRHAPVRPTDVADVLVGEGRWLAEPRTLIHRAHRYVRNDSWAAPASLQSTAPHSTGPPFWAASALADAAGWLASVDLPPRRSMVTRCGAAAWFVGLAVEHLDRTQLAVTQAEVAARLGRQANYLI